MIVFDNVSKFYGEVLGVNRVTLQIGPGITSLVGPNGSGKTTLMNLVTGLLRPTRGRLSVLDIGPDRPELLMKKVGYCTQYDAFPPGLTGYEFILSTLRLHGLTDAEARTKAQVAIAKVGLQEAAGRRVAGYSKGMRQRIRLAQAIAHDPEVVVLDEPLNGLDPMARAETIALFEQLAKDGKYVLLSSHILHEVDLLSDRVVLVHHGYIVAEGEIPGVREEIQERPAQILLRCDRPSLVASRIFELDSAVEIKIHEDHKGLLIHTRDAEKFYLLVNRLVMEHELDLEAVSPADEDVQAVYRYLIESDGGQPS
ncbi:MAG TPA: ABC transporter ATP-binding protein [Candidatus Polarisedimenticolaceae bacterium]|nr:ABC transporter ATP-binding protein [Candidatus Polarisedimenticolaceae bacterium]